MKGEFWTEKPRQQCPRGSSSRIRRRRNSRAHEGRLRKSLVMEIQNGGKARILPDTREFRTKSPTSRFARNRSASSRSKTQSHIAARRNVSRSAVSTSRDVDPRSPDVRAKSGLRLSNATASAVVVFPTPGTPCSRITRPEPFPRMKSWSRVASLFCRRMSCFWKWRPTSDFRILLCSLSIFKSLNGLLGAVITLMKSMLATKNLRARKEYAIRR